MHPMNALRTYCYCIQEPTSLKFERDVRCLTAPKLNSIFCKTRQFAIATIAHFPRMENGHETMPKTVRSLFEKPTCPWVCLSK